MSCSSFKSHYRAFGKLSLLKEIYQQEFCLSKMRAKLTVKQTRTGKRGQAKDYKTNKSIIKTHRREISKQSIEQRPILGASKILIGYSFIANYQPVNFNYQPVNEVRTPVEYCTR